eukprot:TRINITY_DN14836_c0_g1_i1.p1 TRINITY_DN14836_c0_g1~~TRINITY_DN14836_c0_g1_i1.p1  ORF type:complete len:587 (-),score=129.07 TRINITY_DN14836_c0_g1_i1:118-1878(-)
MASMTSPVVGVAFGGIRRRGVQALVGSRQVSHSSSHGSARRRSAVNAAIVASRRRASSTIDTTGGAINPSLQVSSFRPPKYLRVPIVPEEPAAVLADMPELNLSGSTRPSDSTSSLKDKLKQFGDLAATDETQHEQLQQVPSADEVRFAELENGTRVIGVDRKGLCASLGLFVHVGSRYEEAESAFLPHALELVAFRSCTNLNQLQILKTLEQIGASAVCRVGREDLLYQIDVLREFVPVAMPLLLGNVLCPLLLPEELEYAHAHVVEVQRNIDENPEALVGEWLHIAAYKGNTLGQPLYVEEKDIPKFTPERLRDFVQQRCTPDKLILVGVNVDFDELCKWTVRGFAEHAATGGVSATPAPQSVPSALVPAKYSGGELREERPNPLCHVMLGWELEGGWNSPALAAVTVLQMFLGGGGSFSTGGPGKGMHTRLYTEVLNRCEWVESIQAGSAMYTDTGLFTIYATVMPRRAGDFVKVLHRVFQGSISPVDLQRAKNALKSSIHMNLEMRAVKMEDLGRQLILSGKVGTAEEFGQMIDEVTAEDLIRVLKQCLKTNLTLAAVGDIQQLPSYEEINRTFNTFANAER